MPWHHLKLIQTAILSSSAATAPKVPYDPDMQNPLGVLGALFSLTDRTLYCVVPFAIIPFLAESTR